MNVMSAKAQNASGSLRAMRVATRLLLGATVLVVLGEAAVWVARRPMFDVDRIELRAADAAVGLRHVSVAAVRAALRGDTKGGLRGNFFTLRLEDARRVFETVPWVAAASVRRIWPDRLVVTFAEHKALGTWGEGRLLSDAGVLFVANPDEADSDGELPDFDGPERFAREAAQRFRDWSAALLPLRMQIDAITISERASWTLRTRDEVAFELGRDEPPGRITQRLAAVVASWPAVRARVQGSPTRVDLRYANGLAVASVNSVRTP